MDESPPLGSWNLLVTCSVLTSHASTVPSTLQEYTWLEAETVYWALENTVYILIQKRTKLPLKRPQHG